MKFCVSTGVGTWTNWSTFDPDPDHSRMPEPENMKSKVGQTGTSLRCHATGHEMHCRETLFTPRCSPRAVEFPRSAQLFVRCSVAELRGVKRPIFGYWPIFQYTTYTYWRGPTLQSPVETTLSEVYMRSTECPSSYIFSSSSASHRIYTVSQKS